MSDEAGKKVLPLAKSLELSIHHSTKLVNVRRSKVRKPSELRVVPDAFIGVQLRSIGRKAIRPDVPIACQVLLYVA